MERLQPPSKLTGCNNNFACTRGKFSSKKVKNILHSAEKQLPDSAKNADKTLGIIFN